jgi:yeast amino acid transporter
MTGGWNRADFVTYYLPFVLFPIFYFGARYFLYKTPMVDAAEMDFLTGTTQDTYAVDLFIQFDIAA